MIRATLLLLSALLILFVRDAIPAGAGEPATQPAAKLVVQVDKPGAKISPMLWGIFFEEINCAGDGGLYAELIRNRSFEDSEKPDHWTLLSEGAGRAEMAIDTARPMSPQNPRSLRLKVASGGGSVGVANGGWWGVALVKGDKYDLSLCARAEGSAGPLAASLESADGKKIYAKESLQGIGGDWKRLSVTLTAEETDPQARLVLRVAQPATLWLDMISLFPQKTWKGRPNGLRPDLAEMLNELQPAFARFPGGCWVEGDTLTFASRWKRTIGDPADRWNQWNIWQYYSTNGLGYHEYLQMCEDLGAEPLFVINCGMSHKENVPMDQMVEWVQDALDAIEYANGPVESKWGGMRAKAGHPKPFGMKYIEIGNENGGPAYEERYPLFYDAIREKHPQIKIISDVPTRSRPSDIVDEHYYNSPEFFMQNAHRYDTYKRDGAKIYVGEYAVTANAGQGNLKAALGEAAFMTGMERNSDVVVMASYAPLFVNVNHRRWNPNLIDFDSSRVYGIPSYYVQQLFSRHRGDAVLPLELEAAMVEPIEVKKGGIGVGTWVTQAEYKDITVTRSDKVLYQSDFPSGLAGWKPQKGQWAVKDGALHQTGSDDDCRCVASDSSWADYTYSLKARKLGGAEGFLIMFQVRDQKNWLWWNLGGWGNQRHAIEVCNNGGKSMLPGDVPGRIETGRWYDVRVELTGPRIRCYLDGKLIHDVNQSAKQPLYASASRVDSTDEVILKVVNVSKVAMPTDITLSGAKQVQPQATAIVLTSAKPEDENSLDEPAKVAPKTESIAGAATNFRHAFPPHSFTVLRVKAGR